MGSLKDADCIKTLEKFYILAIRSKGSQTNDQWKVKAEKMCLLCHLGFDLNPLAFRYFQRRDLWNLPIYGQMLHV